MVLNLARLRVFEAVVRTGSFAAAADALSFTPSAISQQMARLEAEVGILLVERTARGVQLTPAGELLHLRAQRILAEAQEAFAELNALAGLRSGRLRIGSFPSATQAFTTGVLKAYRERFPGVDVVLVEDEPHHNLARVARSRDRPGAAVQLARAADRARLPQPARLLRRGRHAERSSPTTRTSRSSPTGTGSRTVRTSRWATCATS